MTLKASSCCLPRTSGTGKTTVARLIGRIYKSLVYCPKDMVEVSRNDLVGDLYRSYRAKTERVIDSTMHGILFIDEAYALNLKAVKAMILVEKP